MRLVPVSTPSAECRHSRMFQPWSQTISEPPPAPNPEVRATSCFREKRPRLSIRHSRRIGSLSDRSSILTSGDTLKCCHQIKTSDIRRREETFSGSRQSELCASLHINTPLTPYLQAQHAELKYGYQLRQSTQPLALCSACSF